MIQQDRGEGDNFFWGAWDVGLHFVVFGMVVGRQRHTKNMYWEDEDGMIDMSKSLV